MKCSRRREERRSITRGKLWDKYLSAGPVFGYPRHPHKSSGDGDAPPSATR